MANDINLYSMKVVFSKCLIPKQESWLGPVENLYLFCTKLHNCNDSLVPVLLEDWDQCRGRLLIQRNGFLFLKRKHHCLML